MGDDAPKRRRREIHEEDTDREGHWMREFFARCEPWPIVEQWARDHDFYLVAMRGRRRLYRKGDESSLYRVFIDLKQKDHGSGMKVTAWIESSFLARALHFFFHGPELAIDPSGWVGVFKRREACDEINDLLHRFRQPTILGSQSFHIADIDPSTLFMVVALFFPIMIFLAREGLKVQVHPALSNALLITIGNHLAALLWTAVALCLVHHYGAVKYLRNWTAKFISLGFCTLVFTVVTVVAMTRTTSEIEAQKVSHYCLYHFEEVPCRKSLEAMPLGQRNEIATHLQEMQLELSLVGNRAPKKMRNLPYR